MLISDKQICFPLSGFPDVSFVFTSSSLSTLEAESAAANVKIETLEGLLTESRTRCEELIRQQEQLKAQSCMDESVRLSIDTLQTELTSIKAVRRDDLSACSLHSTRLNQS